MAVKDKLQLILITYNRENQAKNTLTKLMAKDSAVKDFDLLVIDNNSTDNTAAVIAEFMEKHSNITYIKNKYNVGLAGNIVKALEAANKDYVWIIGDDDLYDFSNWAEVEKAINNNEKLICIARYVLPDEYKNNVAYQLFQLTFITGGIYSTSLFNDTTIKNSVDNVYTLFPHIPPIVQYINNGGKVYVVDKAISDNGMNIETTDVSYTRGIDNKEELYDRTNEMSWVLGYSNVISLLKDKKLREECLEVAIPYKDIYGSWGNFYNCMQYQYINSGKINYFLEIYNVLPEEHQKHFHLSKNNLILDNENENLKSKIDKLTEENNSLKSKINILVENDKNLSLQLDNLIDKTNKYTLLQQIFSVKNEGKHKIWRILGIKMKFKRGRL